MKVTNGWGNPNKHNDKFIAKVRLGKVTVYEVLIEISSKQFQVTLLNFTLRL